MPILFFCFRALADSADDCCAEDQNQGLPCICLGLPRADGVADGLGADRQLLLLRVFCFVSSVFGGNRTGGSCACFIASPVNVSSLLAIFLTLSWRRCSACSILFLMLKADSCRKEVATKKLPRRRCREHFAAEELPKGLPGRAAGRRLPQRSCRSEEVVAMPLPR